MTVQCTELGMEAVIRKVGHEELFSPRSAAFRMTIPTRAHLYIHTYHTLYMYGHKESVVWLQPSVSGFLLGCSRLESQLVTFLSLMASCMCNHLLLKTFPSICVSVV